MAPPSSAWAPSHPAQQHVAGLFAMLRPPLPDMKRIVQHCRPRRALELGVADGKMLIAAMAVLQEEGEPRSAICGAGINSLRYYYGTHDVLEEVKKRRMKKGLGAGPERM
eukprot:4162059-Prymnesium_polylepis.1